MAKIKLKINSINNDKPLAKYRHFEIFGNFNDWSTKKNHLKKARLFLNKGNTNNYYNLFHANYCPSKKKDLLDILEIHVAKVYLLNEEENHQLKYDVEKDTYFNLDPSNEKAKVKIKLLVYDLHKRCPEDRKLHLCEIPTNKLVKPFEKYVRCPEKAKDTQKTIPIQPETSLGNILQGGG